MTHAEQHNTHVENVDVWAHEEHIARDDLDEHWENEYPLSTIVIAEPADRHKRWGDYDADEIARANKTYSLLGLAEQVELLHPVVNILTIILVCPIVLFRHTSTAYQVFAASLPRAVSLFTREVMRLTLEKWHADYKKVDWVAADQGCSDDNLLEERASERLSASSGFVRAIS